MTDKLYHYKAMVIKVKDADTLTLDLDLGFCTWLKDDVRLARINAFETKMGKGTTAEMKKKGLAGKAYVTQLVEGKEVVVKTTFASKAREKYGRLLADIYYEQDGNWINLNDTLVTLGYAEHKEY